MKNLYGLTDLKIEIIDVIYDDYDFMNKFLAIHNGNIIDIQPICYIDGTTKYSITYKETNK